MDISSVNSDLIRGNVTTIILGCLLKNDKYGYEILKEIEDKSTGQYALKQATLYNQLKRLEKQGLVNSYDGDPDDTGGGKRRYYSLTAEGKKLLSKEKSEYEYSRTILDKLVSADEFDFTNPTPFDASELRPYSKRDGEEKPKVVYKDKLIEKTVYLNRYGIPITEEEANSLAEQAAADDEKARIKEEELKSAREQLRKSEEDRMQAEEKLRTLEQRQREDMLRREQEISMQQEQLRQEEIRRRQEEERIRQMEEQKKREEEQRPRRSLDELFAKLDAEQARRQAAKEEQSAVDDRQPVAPKQESPAYVNAEPTPPTHSTLKDILKKLDAKEAEIDSAKKQEPVVEEPVVTVTQSAKKETFEYENKDVNYRDFFFNIAEQQDEQPPAPEPKQNYSLDADLKTRLYADGYKIRPYDRGNTSDYYLNNFLYVNTINRDTFLIILAIFAIEMAVLWISLATRISYIYFLTVTLVGVAVCLAPTVVYLINPTRRRRASFNFKLSILNRTMLFIELAMVCILIGFFALGASINDIDLILCSIVIPTIVLLNLPISSLIYWLLYRSRRYLVSA